MNLDCTKKHDVINRALLLCGIAMAPLFNIVLYAQIATRTSFDVLRVPLSLLSLGEFGWVQITNFITTGLLAIAGAVGIKGKLEAGFGRALGPFFIAMFGLGLIAAGAFHPDAALGFPPGTPPGPAPTQSLHSNLHTAAFAWIMLSLVAACGVLSARFAKRGETSWSAYSAITALAVPIFVATAFSTNVWLINTLVAAFGYGWISLLSWKVLSRGDHRRRKDLSYARAG